MVKRYDFDNDGNRLVGPDGIYVLASDYERLEAALLEISMFHAAVKRLDAVCMRDNVTLKLSIPTLGATKKKVAAAKLRSQSDASADPQTTAIRLQSEDSRLRDSQSDTEVK